MATITAKVSAYWLNAWVLRPCARPYIVVDGQERATSWSTGESLEISDPTVTLGAGVRYFGRGELQGYEPHTLSPDDVEGGVIVFRNGFWNHTPFRKV